VICKKIEAAFTSYFICFEKSEKCILIIAILFVLQLIESTLGTNWLDTEFSKSENKTTVIFGPKFLSKKLYQASSTEVS